MIIWLNGAYGSGKTTTAFALHKRLKGSFVYDPENVGYFLRRNSPEIFSKNDFQDFPLWREMNYKMLKMISKDYDGVIIVPMTIVNMDYYNEIIGELIADGLDVRHFILYSSKAEIKRRIKKRTAIFVSNKFELDALDRCVNAFDNYITEEKIYTENMTIDSVVNKIAMRCKLKLLPKRRTSFERLISKVQKRIHSSSSDV